MTRAERIRPARLAACLALAAGPAAAQGYAAEPFHDHPVAVAQVSALELVALRAKAIGAVAQVSDELAEEAERMRTDDLPLVMASLRRADPAAAEALAGAVDGLLAAAEGGAPLAEAVSAVEAAAERAIAALATEAPVEGAPFRGAVASMLLVSEAGLAEAYEEAADGELGAYSTGWAALQRVKAIAAELRPAMSEAVAFEADDALARLDALLPQADPPERFASDPEEAEAFAQRLVGLLEAGADADLYLGRDLPRALGTVRDVAGAGCADADPELGAERIAIARLYHEDALEGPLSILAPEAQETAEEAYEALLAAPSGRSDDACGALLAALDEAGAALPPSASP